MREKAIVSWSGGKDSALALYEMPENCEIVALLTTLPSRRIGSVPINRQRKEIR